jgi:hypothetical protein
VFKFDSITLGQMEDFETVAGVPFDECIAAFGDLDPASGRMPSPRLMTGMAWLLKASQGVTLTRDEARAITFGELLADMESAGGEDEDPESPSPAVNA